MVDPVTALRFDPEAATVIRTPPGTGYGHWVGGHKVSHDAGSGTFALFYRERTPLEADRGGVCRVATGTDGVHFDDVWEATKDDLAATSIEVGHCLRHDAGEWRLYVSYEYATSRTWRVDVLRGPDPSRLDTQGRRTVLAPADYGLGFLKDPVVYRRPDGYAVYVTGPARQPAVVAGSTVTARPRDATLLGVSADGLYFPTLKWVFEAPGDDSWHGRRARLNSIIGWDGGWVATFDGGRTTYDNYEEWCGLATSTDGRNFTRLDTGGPWVRSPHGSVRYLYLLRVGARVYAYFEHTREDLSHDLRVAVIDL